MTTKTETSEHKMPRLFWATVACFSINLTIAGAVWFSPKLRVDMYGAAREHVVHAFSKPSPFTEVVQTKVAKVRRPERLKPVTFEATAPTQTNAEVAAGTPLDPYARVEESMSYPRVTASVRPVSMMDVANN